MIVLQTKAKLKMCNRLFSIFFAAIFCLASLNAKEGYKIDIQINGLADALVILGHYVNQTMYPDDTVIVDSKGQGTFEGVSTLDEGMYIIYMPGPKFFDILIGSDQFFKMEVDTGDFVETAVFEGSLDNSLFFDFKKYMNQINTELEEVKAKYDKTNKENEKEKLKKKLEDLDKSRRNKIKEISTEHPDLWVSTFLKATVDIEVPDPPKDENGNLIDSNWSYKYYRTHYFDNFELSDTRLLRTPLYESKMMKYIDKVIPQIPDTIIKEVDFIIQASEHDSNHFRYVMITLFNHFGKSKIMGMESVQVHIAEKYYIDRAWWSSEKYIADLKERVKAMKPTLIGKIAPDIQLKFVPAEHFKMAADNDSIKEYPHAGTFFNVHTIQSEYTLLMFWDPTCSHCKKDVPKFYKIFTDTILDMGVKVIAINTLGGEEGKIKWVDFINKHELYEWVNAWNPYTYEHKQLYDIRTNPQFFILDNKKEIIAKRIGGEQVVNVINTHKKYINKQK